MNKKATSRFDAFTEQARHVLIFAKEEAHAFQHSYIGTEHLLLGLIREEESGAARVLAQLGINLNKVRSAIAYMIGIGDQIVLGEVGLTPHAKRVVELAVDEARRLKHHAIGTEHLLLGIVSQRDCVAARVLENLGVSPQEITTHLRAIFNPPAQPAQPSIQEQRNGIVIPPGFQSAIRTVQQLEALAQRDPRVLSKLIQEYKKIIGRLQPHKNPLFYASLYHRMGVAYRLLPIGNHEENLKMAITCFQEALRFYTPEVNPMHPAETQNSLGNTYGDLLTEDRTANLEKAIHCYEEALRFYTPQTDPLAYAAIQNNIGITYVDIQTKNRITHLEKAIVCFHEALRFRTPETDPLKYAETQNNLGVAYCNLPNGDRTAHLKLAIWCYQEALRFWTPEVIPPLYAKTQVNLGNAYSNLPTGNRKENLKNAIECYQKALYFLTPEVDPLAYTKAQITMGNAYRILLTDPAADLTKAIECYQKALRFLTPEIDPLAYAGTQNNLGLAYGALLTETPMTSLARSIECFQEALRFRTPEIDPDGYAATQNNLGFAYFAYRDFVTEDRSANLAKAIICFQEALRFYTLATDPSERRRIARNLAELYFDQGSWNMALSSYRIAMEAGEYLYRIGLSTESKTAEISEDSALYSQAAFAAVRYGETAEALLILERGKTRLLTEALRLRVRRPAQVPDMYWQAFEQAAEAVRAQQTDKTRIDEGVPDPVAAYEAYVQMAQAATVAFERAIQDVRSYAPHFLQVMDLSTVEAHLSDERTTLIAFCITEQGSLGFVIHRTDQLVIQVVEVATFTQKDLQHLFAARDADGSLHGGWLHGYNRQQADPMAWHETITRILEELGKHLLTPVLSVLPAAIERLIFLPSAELFLFPLHAAPLSEKSSLLLCDRYEISYAPSLEVRAHGQARVTGDVVPSLYAVVNPEEHKNLPFTPMEGTTIAHLFRDPIVDAGSVGTKERVLAGMREQTYIHFSCHGSYNWDDPSASALYLAHKQPLTLADLQQESVDLSNVRLVTLSACETSMTDVTRNSGEYVGIPAGFLLAGVPCVIGSLWAVEELSTALLMERFYRNHLQDGMNFAAALSEAQRWLRGATIQELASQEKWRQIYQYSIRAGEQISGTIDYYRSHPEIRPFAHPYYWAAFTVNGL